MSTLSINSAIKIIDLKKLKSKIKELDKDSVLRDIGMENVMIEHDAIFKVSSLLTPIMKGRNLAIIFDETMIKNKGVSLKEKLCEILNKDFQVKVVRISSCDGGDVHADEKTLLEAYNNVRGCDGVVAVGSGTIADIAKDVVYRHDCSIPLVIVQTALSVNAFSDDVAVVLRNGVKRTISSAWANTLIIDLNIIKEAPFFMNVAGFGDLMATWSAPVDWMLSNKLEMDSTYNQIAYDLIKDGSKYLLDNSRLLSCNDSEYLGKLSEVLTLSGFAMGLVGVSSPCSGAEHIVSHLLDMDSLSKKGKVGSHGEQIGVSSILMSMVWEYFLNNFDPKSVDIDRCFPDFTIMEDKVRSAFRGLDRNGRASEECWNDYNKKLSKWHMKRDKLEDFFANWHSNREMLLMMCVSPVKLANSFRGAGGKSRFKDLEVGISKDKVLWALNNCHLFRNRFTIVDLLFFLGIYNEQFVEELLSSANKIDVGY